MPRVLKKFNMKKFGIVLLVILGLFFATASWGQKGTERKANDQWEPPGQFARMFDPKNLETFSGEVTTVDQLKPGYSMSDRVWLALNTDKGIILVILGPTWFHKLQNFKIEPKDQLEIKGSMITSMEEPLFIATEVKKGDQVLKLREDSGYPVWSPPKRNKQLKN